ncbi:glutathione S-transferase [Caulobacter sp. Root487D2Y]|uniref:glutathione S-transferase family protein n=1 Tax=Caulobacter sp. Root487D2Y TaxID=1736547 RepID=UPI0006FCBC5E|nr:glutathione S-transferase [Caulobacter sp. Root487D2Y]KQY27318.1 glutathione S-transferase [Caulobacter sp. Root487D2Y]
MKLYDSRRAPNPRRVRWFMAEKGIEDIEIVDVDIFGGQHRTPEYLAKAGLPNVPALEMDNGQTITESVAICRYLESVYPEPNLFGRDACEAAVVEMWMRRAEMMVATPLMMLVRHTHPALAAIETQVPEIAASNKAIAEKGLKMLDRQLAQSEFIACDRLTMADILAATGLDFARMARFRPDPELVNVKRWLDGMMARPAAKAGV